MPKRADVIKKLKATLNAERFEHSLRVEKIAVALARRHGVSAKSASLAGLLHDYARKYSRRELLRQARRFKLKIDPVRRFEPKLFHAELSARLAKRDFGIASAEILRAIERHTAGTARMTLLEKIIFLADHIEEGRNYAWVKKTRALANKNLDRAIIGATSNMLRYLLNKNLPVYPATVNTRNYYLLA